MKITVPIDGGEPIEFECADSWVSQSVCSAILAGKTYPFLPFVDDVRVVCDVGGTAVPPRSTSPITIRMPGSTPSNPPRHLVRSSNATSPVSRTYRSTRIGLHAIDQEVPLYLGDGDAGMASIVQRSVNLEEFEMVRIRAAGVGR